MNKYTFALIVILLAALVAVGYRAAQGNLAAVVTLAVLVAVALILVGVGLTLTIVHVTDTSFASKQEHRQHMAHTKERLRESYELQRLMNAQNDQLFRQLKAQASLPEPSPVDGEVIQIDERLFSEFDE